MDKKYIALVSVVIALWAGFMVFRHVRGKREGQEFREKEYARITEVAKHSPRAGLNQMARALKKYYQEKRRYPKDLNVLYPKYVRNKSFIDDLDWYYRPKKDDFLLTKTVVRKNKRMVASVDKRLKPWVKGSVMVASPTAPQKAKKARQPKRDISEELKISAKSRDQFWQALRQKQTDRSAVRFTEDQKEKIITIPQPEIITVARPRTPSNVEATFSQRYLVWKSQQGTLGFGNVEYPESETQSRYAMGSWYNLKIPEPEKIESVSAEEKVAKRSGPEAIASNLAPQYLVWKGQRGTLGFGNVQYPKKDHVYVFETDTWVYVPQPVVAVEPGLPEEYSVPKKKSKEGIASDFSRQYLVWKDQNGTLGFGNVQCPEAGPVSVYQADAWVAFEKSPLPQETEVDRG
ncbi:MAG: hypothetical protein JRI47_04225, partial [Deltaproteobacteria bacterium]|nr:hypothetical protein [Deltaproteobacteria bacterium]